MIHRVSCRGAAGLLLLLALLGAGCGRRAPLAGHDVLLLSIETFRADFAGFHGSPWGCTPGLDSLAAESILPESAYTAAPWTRPSMASLWTGRSPARHGVTGQDPACRLPAGMPTLAGVLSDAGYGTFGCVSNANLSPELGFDGGFDEYLFLENASAAEINREALRWIGERAADPDRPPLFVALHYGEPHRAFFTLPFYAPELGRGRAAGIRACARLEEGERRWALERYRALVGEADAAAAAFAREAVRLLGDRTVVVVTGDHGEEWFDHGALFHGYTLYEELVRVPFLIRAPGLPPGRPEGPFRNTDLLPTLAGWLGVKAPAGMDGEDLGAALLGRGSFPEETVLATSFEQELAALLRPPWKLIRNGTTGGRELYRLDEDRWERDDLAGAEAERAAEMEARLELLLERAACGAPRGEPGEARGSAADEAELRERLTRLGYLGGRPAGGEPWPEGRPAHWEEIRRAVPFVAADHPRFTYAPEEWKKAERPPRRIGSRPGERASVEAVFREVEIRFGRHPWSGIAEIRVDGERAGRIDLYAAEGGGGSALFPLAFPDRRRRRIEVVVTGERSSASAGGEILLDGIRIVR